VWAQNASPSVERADASHESATISGQTTAVYALDDTQKYLNIAQEWNDQQQYVPAARMAIYSQILFEYQNIDTLWRSVEAYPARSRRIKNIHFYETAAHRVEDTFTRYEPYAAFSEEAEKRLIDYIAGLNDLASQYYPPRPDIRRLKEELEAIFLIYPVHLPVPLPVRENRDDDEGPDEDRPGFVYPYAKSSSVDR
jgi:hypothetical protein